MSRRLVAILFLAVCGDAYATAEEFAAGIFACREIPSNEARLQCYDALSDTFDLQIEGKGSSVTDLFKIEEPRLLLYNSNDAIMIMYLLDPSGNVVQNLHRGGSGGGQYLIAEPGEYKVQVNATGTWSLKIKSP